MGSTKSEFAMVYVNKTETTHGGHDVVYSNVYKTRITNKIRLQWSVVKLLTFSSQYLNILICYVICYYIIKILNFIAEAME